MNIRRLVAEERVDLVAFLRTLSDDEWDAPSLCAGWRVRDVVGHLLGHTYRLPSYLVLMAGCGFSADRTNVRLVKKAQVMSPSTLVHTLESPVRRGQLAAFAPSIALADAVVHHQDIRRPLGRQRAIPAERLLAVLDRPDPFAHPRPRSSGLRFVATDVPWSSGRGPEVRGPGEAIVLAVAGRGAVLDELEGDGVALLRKRLGQG